MSAMPVTASLPPAPPSSLPLCPRKQQSAQTELFPLRVIMAANRWGLGAESLEDAGAEMLHELKSGIQPKKKVEPKLQIRWKIIFGK